MYKLFHSLEITYTGNFLSKLAIGGFGEPVPPMKENINFFIF